MKIMWTFPFRIPSESKQKIPTTKKVEKKKTNFVLNHSIWPKQFHAFQFSLKFEDGRVLSANQNWELNFDILCIEPSENNGIDFTEKSV